MSRSLFKIRTMDVHVRRSGVSCDGRGRPSFGLGMIIVLLVAFALPASGQEPAPTQSKESLAKILSSASKPGRFEAPSAGELREVEGLFQRTILRLGDLNDSSNDDLQLNDLVVEWRSQQMEFRNIELTISPKGKSLGCWILRELDDAKRGRGIYLFNPHGGLRDMAIQAPHSFFDRHTRAINVRMFETGHFAAAAWNTVRRSEVDLAHHRLHYLNAFTTAWASVHSRASVVQLHGFANDKRTTAAGRTADLIISDGTRYPADRARRLATAASTELAEQKIMLYPFDCNELGATSNAQGKLLRSAGHSGFLHLEMSPGFRDLLRRDANTLAAFVNSILALAPLSPNHSDH